MARSGKDRRLKPVRSILDSRFKYTNAASTDIRKTFELAKQRIEQDKSAREQCVRQLPRKDHRNG